MIVSTEAVKDLGIKDQQCNMTIEDFRSTKKLKTGSEAQAKSDEQVVNLTVHVETMPWLRY